MYRLLLLASSLSNLLVYSAPQPPPTPSGDPLVESWSKQLAEALEPVPDNGPLPGKDLFRRDVGSEGDPESRFYESFSSNDDVPSLPQQLNNLGNLSTVNKRQKNVQFDGRTLTLRLPKFESLSYEIVFPFTTVCEDTKFSIGLQPPKAPNQPWGVTTNGVTVKDLRNRLIGVSDQDLGLYSNSLFAAVLNLARFVFNRIGSDDTCKEGYPRPQLKRDSPIFAPSIKRDINTYINATRTYIFGFLDRVNFFYLGLSLAYFFNAVRLGNPIIAPFEGDDDDDPEVVVIRRRARYFMEVMVQYLYIDQIRALTGGFSFTREIVLFVVHPMVSLLFDTVTELVHDIQNALNSTSSGTASAHKRRVDGTDCLNFNDFFYTTQHLEDITRENLNGFQGSTTKGCPNQQFPVNPP